MLAVWLIFVLALILFLNGRSGTRFRGLLKTGLLAGGFLLIGGLIAVGSRYHLERTYPAAVVVASETPLSAGPGTQYPASAVLHSGAEVSTLEHRGHWVHLAGPDQTPLGWVPAAVVETVN